MSPEFLCKRKPTWCTSYALDQDAVHEKRRISVWRNWWRAVSSDPTLVIYPILHHSYFLISFSVKVTLLKIMFVLLSYIIPFIIFLPKNKKMLAGLAEHSPLPQGTNYQPSSTILSQGNPAYLAQKVFRWPAFCNNFTNVQKGCQPSGHSWQMKTS